MERLLFYLFFALVLASCGHKKAVVAPSRSDYYEQKQEIAREEDNVSKQPSNSSDLRADIVKEAMDWIGVPYKFAGEDKNGVDCSGFVSSVFLNVTGIKLPRNSSEQRDYCSKIVEPDALEGDLVFFSSKVGGSHVSHVGIYLGGGRFIHTSTSKGVIINELSEKYYSSHLIGFGSVPGLDQDAKSDKRSKASVKPDGDAETIRDAVRNALR